MRNHLPMTGRRGFTLVEVMAAVTVIAIVLPTIMYGISLATNVAGVARHRTQATTLAQGKLNELLVTGDWQNGTLSGDFGDRWPEYHWKAAVNTWDSPTVSGLTSSLQQLDVTVTWTMRG